MSVANASPIGRSHQEKVIDSAANASPIGRSHQEKVIDSVANASPIGRSHQEKVIDSAANAKSITWNDREKAAEVIFRDLPATFPDEDRYRKPSVIGSVIFHGFLILMVVLIPLLLPQSISERELLVTLVSPIGPPPPPPPPPLEAPATAVPHVAQTQVRPVTPGALITPVAIPKETLKLVEEPIAPPVGIIGGVPGGVPGGIAGGVLGGILSSNANANPLPVLAPPPPPPPPPVPPAKVTAPAEPVRVGGDVREPRPLRMVPPIYPPLASKARVSGTVVLEATLTVQGTVEQIRVVSGHPLLVDAAIACMKQWQYEPTLLNGVPVSVILTAKVHFQRAPLS